MYGGVAERQRNYALKDVYVGRAGAYISINFGRLFYPGLFFEEYRSLHLRCRFPKLIHEGEFR
jgi:hypothetical protein